jgi:hypothetical protein
MDLNQTDHTWKSEKQRIYSSVMFVNPFCKIEVTQLISHHAPLLLKEFPVFALQNSTLSFDLEHFEEN